MLSFIMRLAFDFERQHGSQPNLLYLNIEHLEHLRRDFDNSTDIQAIAEQIGMEIIIDPDAMHPRVAWIQANDQLPATG